MVSRRNTAEKIIKTAIDVIARQGYQNTSIKNITDKLGLTKPAIYAHFTGKAEIARKIIEMYESEQIDRVYEKVDSLQGNALEKIHLFFNLTSRSRAEDPQFHAAFISLRSHLKNDPEFEVILTKIRVKMETHTENILRLGMKQGLFKHCIDPKMTAMFILAATRGLFEDWMDHRSRLDGEQVTRALRTALLKGIEA